MIAFRFSSFCLKRLNEYNASSSSICVISCSALICCRTASASSANIVNSLYDSSERRRITSASFVALSRSSKACSSASETTFIKRTVVKKHCKLSDPSRSSSILLFCHLYIWEIRLPYSSCLSLSFCSDS